MKTAMGNLPGIYSLMTGPERIVFIILLLGNPPEERPAAYLPAGKRGQGFKLRFFGKT
jgi:hypothetical protein